MCRYVLDIVVKKTLILFPGITKPLLKWTALMFSIRAAMAIYARNFVHRRKLVQMLSQEENTKYSMSLIRLSDGRILVPPTLSYLRVYVRPSDSPIYSNEHTLQYSDFIWNNNDSNRLKSVECCTVSIPHNLNYADIVSKVIVRFKQFAMSYSGGAVPISDLLREIDHTKSKYTVEMSGGELTNVTDLRVFGIVKRSMHGSKAHAKLRYDSLKIHFKKFQLTRYQCDAMSIDGRYKFSLKSRNTSSFTAEIMRVVYCIIVKVSAFDDGRCRADLLELKMSDIGKIRWKFGNHPGKDVPGVANFVKTIITIEFKRIMNGVIKRYFETAINALVVVDLESIDAAEMPVMLSVPDDGSNYASSKFSISGF